MPLYFGKKVVGDTAHTVEYVGAKVLEDEVIINPTREDSGNPDTVQYDVYTEPFLDINDEEFDAINNIKVRKVGSWIDSEISADNIRKGKSILGVAGNIIELVPEKISLKSSSTQKIVTPSQGNGFTEITVEPYILEQKTISPSKYNVNVYPSSGYDALSRVTVNAVTSDVDSNIKPENIKKDVNILGVTGTLEETIEADPILEELTITPTTSSQTIRPNEGVDGFNKVSVNAVTSSIDSNILPKNIKRGVNILGVEGNYVIENLQDKVVNPSVDTQVVTFDDGFEGLSNVTITPVTSSIDSNIIAENIREGVSILGVTGTLEDDVVEIEPTITVTPSTTATIVKPSDGYDALSQVNIEGVTASIDPNILAENIKKNIEILGVKGTLEAQNYSFQESKEITPSTVDMEITPDSTYDALLKVIVKAVTASIDPNILPKNIKKNVSILGVVGTVEEGEAQKWFDFEGLQGFTPLNKITIGAGGHNVINKTLVKNEYIAKEFIDDNFSSIGNISAALFNVVTGYDNLETTYNILEQPFIAFIGGKYYADYSKMVTIEDQVRYLYPFENNYGVKGCLLNYEDDGSEKTLNVYVIMDSTGVNSPVPVLIDGSLSLSMLPEGYDSYRYVSPIIIPEHTVFQPKTDASFTTHWLKDEGVNYVINEHNDKPLTIDVSAWDIDNGQEEEIEIQYTYDYTIEGSLNISEDNKISGFSDGNMMKLNKIISFAQNDKFELQMKVTTGSNLNDYQEIFTISPPLLLRIYNGRWQMPYYIGSWQSSTKDSVSANTTYYTVVKYFPSQTTQDGYTYTARYMYLEIYDENKSLLHRYSYNLSSTFLQFNGSLPFIGSQGGAEHWSGSIHLNECYIKVNDALVWDGNPLTSFETTNHNIMPITRDLMFYPKSQSIGKEELTYPFEAKLIDLSTLVDGNNFIINSSLQGITSGPSSYQVNSGISRGYIKHKSGNKSGRLDVTCYTSSEAGCDFGGVYVGKKQWNPSRSDLENNYNDGTGSWIYRSMGNTSVVNCSATLEPNTEYYITFMYTKDGSVNGGEDRFVIQKIAIDGIEISAGNLINYEDDGSAVEMPLYYSSFGSGSKSFSQPILTENGTMGGSSFAVSADHETNGNNPAWYAFDGNDNTYWRGGNVPGYIDFYNPKAMVVKNIRWGFFYSYPTSGNVQGSNNGSTWENIIDWTNGVNGDFDIDLSSNTTAYKYYRINVSSVNMDVIHCKQLTITGEIDASESVYVFSPDDSFVDGENYTNATLVDIISIPEHNADFILDSSTGKFVESKTITINVEDENTTIYTKIED